MENLKRLVSSGFDDKAIRPKYESKRDGKISRKQKIQMASSMNSEVNDDILSPIMSNTNYLLENNGGMLKDPLKEVKSQFNNNQNSSSRRNQKPNKTLKSIMLKPSKGFRFEVGSNRNAEAPKTKLQKIKDEMRDVLLDSRPKEGYERQDIKYMGLMNQLDAEMVAVADEAEAKAIQLHKEENKPKGTMFGNFMTNVFSYLGCGSRRGRESEGDKAPVKSFAELKSERMRMQAQREETRGDKKLKRLKLPNPVRYSREDEDDDDVFE